MKVKIDRDRDGWFYAAYSDVKKDEHNFPLLDMKSSFYKTFYDCKRAALLNSHEISNGGWNHKMLMWNFNGHGIDGFPEWEIEDHDLRVPAYIKLTHIRRTKETNIESSELCIAWDSIAEVDFYQRDWTSDGIPFVNESEKYYSGWWFQTIKERDRFFKWCNESENDLVFAFG